MKHWLMLQEYTALNTMYRYTSETNDLHISKRQRETNRLHINQENIHLRYNKDAEANDMIYLGSD